MAYVPGERGGCESKPIDLWVRPAGPQRPHGGEPTGQASGAWTERRLCSRARSRALWWERARRQAVGGRRAAPPGPPGAGHRFDPRCPRTAAPSGWWSASEPGEEHGIGRQAG